VAVGPLSSLSLDAEEPAFEQRIRLRALEKSAIAEAAARLVGSGESVGLDVGTSILALANVLAPRRDLRVFTNNLRVGMQWPRAIRRSTSSADRCVSQSFR